MCEILIGLEYGIFFDVWRLICFLDIVYGFDFSDWFLVWVVEFEYLVYEFWMLVERFVIMMLGIWVE